jgi:hypothetical protein
MNDWIIAINLISILLMVSYYLNDQSKNKTSLYVFQKLDKIPHINIMNSIECYLFSDHYGLRIKSKDLEDLANLRNFIQSYEFNLPIRSFKTSQKLKREINEMLNEFKDATVWNLKNGFYNLNKTNLAKKNIKKDFSRYDSEIYSHTYRTQLIKQNRRIKKHHQKFLTLLVKNRVFSI